MYIKISYISNKDYNSKIYFTFVKKLYDDRMMKELVIMVAIGIILSTCIAERSIKFDPFWEGEVTLIENATFSITAHTSGKIYEIKSTTALGGLDASSKKGGFNYTVDDRWYEQYGSLLVDSIAGVKNDGMDGWQYWVNYPDEPLPWVGVDKYELEEGDTVDFFYGGFGINPDVASMLIRIHVHVKKDELPPSVEFIKPSGGIYLLDREIMSLPGFSIVLGKINVEVNAFDNESGIKKVSFYVDDELVKEDESEPYEWMWNGAVGMHTIKAIAYDKALNHCHAESRVWILSP